MKTLNERENENKNLHGRLAEIEELEESNATIESLDKTVYAQREVTSSL